MVTCRLDKFLLLAFHDVVKKVGQLRKLGKPLAGDPVQVAMGGMVGEAKCAI